MNNTESKYRVKLAWGVKDPHTICNAKHRAIVEVIMPYSQNPYYILAYTYKKLDAIGTDLPFIDDIYILDYEIL